ncbi:type III-B CRISPR module-associated protein Cmr5 [Clostridium botulinum]|uniref:CRISPR type III-B/RAMP module-associated protein Cmr5 n=1 Tax=Clostridium botulinum (strain Langeland / NCTC 10281 / Type F) TaxID=441772 RepID=A7GFA6_CLOBL|nr:type III-B CRISPR module-associated protein Cmr5 [Clostridium botulinum]ABS40544.1 CRISPR-associated protein, Cmr5 family [Clostridium botulinum F str. Langeland]ADF99869.1 CRISPR-associated protein, Cmr5 family [Clostridium botulinum F str. 230613]KKM42558.1 CRISPR-associated protein Cmr5 [Clostridium botulinum]MBY6792957.1 type III-B CRISPR module-associated protein Cmr5 [Clostridium botulinum]MBY6937166.1 type III-B CRISPR module-associated protein Cmr5 [Clostridium botulinum]
MGDLKNVNLQVAQFALEKVKEVLNYYEKEILKCKEEEREQIEKKQKMLSSKYKTLSKKMTVLIQKNGLIGTLVFILSKVKKEKANELVLQHIINWCEEDCKLDFLRVDKENTNPNEAFIENITKLSNQEYRLVTKEIMNLFGWIKRFTDGMIEGEVQND